MNWPSSPCTDYLHRKVAQLSHTDRPPVTVLKSVNSVMAVKQGDMQWRLCVAGLTD